MIDATKVMVLAKTIAMKSDSVFKPEWNWIPEAYVVRAVKVLANINSTEDAEKVVADLVESRSIISFTKKQLNSKTKRWFDSTSYRIPDPNKPVGNRATDMELAKSLGLL